MAELESINYKVIGYFRCHQSSPVESPRQGVLATSSRGTIELLGPYGGAALDDLFGMERVWLIYDFHRNDNWKAKVQPPRGSSVKRGVFATRSPYRPNSIGMSCVKLEGVEKSRVIVVEHDLLDGTPILDIKPYLPYADSFENSKTGWLNSVETYDVQFSDRSLVQLKWLGQQMNLDVQAIVINQLQYEPTNRKLKRVSPAAEGFMFSYKTWRVFFTVENKRVFVDHLDSGYRSEELFSVDDPYGDKEIHRSFLLLA